MSTHVIKYTASSDVGCCQNTWQSHLLYIATIDNISSVPSHPQPPYSLIHTHKHTQMHTHTLTQTHTHTHTHRQTHTHTLTQTDTHTDRHTHTHSHRQTYTHSHRHTDTHRHTHTLSTPNGGRAPRKQERLESHK